MLTKRELKDIRWMLVSNIKEIDNKMLKPKDANSLQDFALTKAHYERLFNRIDLLIQKGM